MRVFALATADKPLSFLSGKPNWGSNSNFLEGSGSVSVSVIYRLTRWAPIVPTISLLSYLSILFCLLLFRTRVFIPQRYSGLPFGHLHQPLLLFPPVTGNKQLNSPSEKQFPSDQTTKVPLAGTLFINTTKLPVHLKILHNVNLAKIAF